MIIEGREYPDTMNVKIRVWSGYGADSRLSLLGEKTLTIPNGCYAAAHDLAKDYMRELGGRSAAYEADGWNQNYNIKFIS